MPSEQSNSDWPKPVVSPIAEDDIVQVLMPRRLARCFERRCLPVAATLVGPVAFSDDDLPSYVIQIASAAEVERQIKAAFPRASSLAYPEDSCS